MYQKLKRLYDETEAQQIYDRILSLIKYFQQFTITDGNRYQFSEKDVMLIAYPDHLQKDGNDISVLHDFLLCHYESLINSVHLLPFYPYSSDDGFSVIDYQKVDPKLDGWNSIIEFSKTHRLMFDGVINHISAKSKWFQGFLNNEEKFENYFIWYHEKQNISQVVRPRTHELLSRFQRKNRETAYVWTTFSKDQIDLNYANPTVLFEVLEVLLFYVSQGAKFIRLDAIAYLWKRLGTTCIHLEETHVIVQIIREVLDLTFPEVALVTETNVPHQENISYFADETVEAQMVYQFTLPPLTAYSILKNNVHRFVAWAKSLTFPKTEACFFNFTASHDGIGVRPLEGILETEEIQWLAEKVTEKKGKISYKTNKDGSKSPYELNISYVSLLTDNDNVSPFLLSQALALTMPGVPGIYFASLIGAENDHEGVTEKGYNRAINRQKFELDTLKDNISKHNSRKIIFEQYKAMLTIRTAHTVFHPKASFEIEVLSDSSFLIKRVFEDNSLYAFFNFGKKEIDISIIDNEHKDIIDLFSNKKVKSNMKLQPYHFLWLLKKTE